MLLCIKKESLPIANAQNFRFVEGAVESANLVRETCINEGVDTIMHFAAQTCVDNSFGNSMLFTECNIMGTHVLLEVAESLGAQLKLFIYVSTDEVYGEGKDSHKMTEMDVLEPTNPYAATKAGGEFLAKAYHRSFGVPLIITRGNNVYGPHQYPEKIVSKFISQLLRKRPVTLHGGGSHRRNFIHVEDCAAAFDVILQHGVIGQVYNIGSDNEVTNIDLALQLIRLCGLADQQDIYISFVEDRPFNDQKYSIDWAALKALGWSETVPWEEGLASTVEWYKQVDADYWEGSIESALVSHPRRSVDDVGKDSGRPERMETTISLAVVY